MDGKGSGVSLLVMVLAAALSVLALADEDVYYSKLIEIIIMRKLSSKLASGSII